jgi:general secretion pathway protein D
MMKKIQKFGMKLLIAMAMIFGLVNNAAAENSCSTKLFSVTIDSKLTISDVIENLADTCELTVIVNDDAAKQRMNKKLYFVKLKNSTLKGFLNTILKDNDLHYTLEGNKLKISYLITKTFRIHYISGQRKGISTANVTIANPQDDATGGDNGSTSATGIEITNTDEFQFWTTVEKEVQRILIGAADGSIHYVKEGETWIGPDGKVWEYNPLAPIVNPEAGMVTVTGTQKQIDRVTRYVKALTDQIKSQVMIDVRILSVAFDDSRKAGVDWSQIYALQNFTINSVVMAQNDIGGATYELETGITEFTPTHNLGNLNPDTAQALVANGHIQINDLVKFLGTQGDVKSISSPRVMTLNNQPAMISVGKELFYKLTATGALNAGGDTTTTTDIVDSVFAGILLDITPEIGSDGLITLKVNPSVSEAAETVSSESGARQIPPDLVRRQIASVIKVRDGQHAILGGLITSQTGYKNNKVPVLGDIPVLGYAFKSEEKINTVEELVLIITPHVVDQSKDVTLKDLGYTKLNEK